MAKTNFAKKNLEIIKNASLHDCYNEISDIFTKKYNMKMPSIADLFFGSGDLNVAYTSRYFAPNPELCDNSYIFIGPPVCKSIPDPTFPFDKLEGKKVIYISLGTVFNNTDDSIYQTFFDAFGDTNATVVMAAFKIDTSKFKIPSNFIVRNFVPQSDILKYATAAITHSGMNSTSDLIYYNVPFISIPIGSDQFFMANRCAELGAAICLDKNKLTPELVKSSLKEVVENPQYLRNIKKISDSFKSTGGYVQAVDEILNLIDKRSRVRA